MKKIVSCFAIMMVLLLCPLVLASCGVKDLINPKPIVTFQEDLVYFVKDDGLPTPQSVTYSDYEVPGTFKYVEDDKNKIEVGIEKAYRYIFTPEDTSSFKTVKSNIKLIAVDRIMTAEDLIVDAEEGVIIVRAAGDEKETVVLKDCDLTAGFRLYGLNVIFDNCTFDTEAEMKLVGCTVIKEIKVTLPDTIEVLAEEPAAEQVVEDER